MTNLIAIVLVTLLLTPVAQGVSPPTDRFTPFDNAFRERKDPERAKAALAGYRALLVETPRAVEAGWRVAMACEFVGNRLTSDEDEKAKTFAEGREAARAAVDLDPKCAPCHFWMAIDMARYGGTVGKLKMLFTLGMVRDHLQRASELEPSYAFGGSFRVLGAIEQALPGFLGGSNDRARDYFSKAIAASPDEPMNYEAMARLLEDEFNDRGTALTFARQGLAVPEPGPERVEALEAKEELRQRVKRYEAANLASAPAK